MKIYDALKKDHLEVKALLSRLLTLSEDDSKSRNELVTEIRDALIPHSRAEEAVFYNALRSVNQEKKEVWHGYAEHAAAEGLLRTLQVTGKVGAGWKSTAESLKKALEHHIQEEETTLFAAARNVFSDDEAEQIGVAFEALKPKIKEESIIGTTFDMIQNLMPPRFSKNLSSLELRKSL